MWRWGFNACGSAAMSGLDSRVPHMVDIVLFHHAHGQTPGFHAFGSELRARGHVVHTPDLYDGRVFEDLEEGVAFAEELGFHELIRRGRQAAEALPSALVCAGFSMGTLPAQALAQTRPGAAGALFYHGGLPTATFEQPWPAGTPVQLHTMEQDPWAEFEEMDAFVHEVPDAEFFRYPGSGHLFADPGLADYDEAASALLLRRTHDFLERVSARLS